MRRVLEYLTEDDLVTREAIKESVDVLGTPGPYLNLADAVAQLNREHAISAPLSLYNRFYIPLSHFYAHPSAFALMRHVRRNGKLHRRAEPAWARRSAVRLADGCAGLMAAAVSQGSGIPTAPFAKYAEAHIRRTLTPAGTLAGKSFRQSADWRKLPQAYHIIVDVRHYLAGPASAGSPAIREARVRSGFEKAFAVLRLDVSEGTFQPAIDGMVNKVLSSLNGEQPEQGQEATA